MCVCGGVADRDKGRGGKKGGGGGVFTCVHDINWSKKSKINVKSE